MATEREDRRHDEVQQNLKPNLKIVKVQWQCKDNPTPSGPNHHAMNSLTTKLKVSSPNVQRHRLPPQITANIDLNIFRDAKPECARSPDDIPITERCAHSLRLCTASRYFDAIKTSKMDEDTKRALFVEFNEVVYNMVVDDTTHFVSEHANDIQQVHDEWTLRYGLPKCSVSECTKTARHYTRGRRERGRTKEDDAVYSFYESLYDRVHHFIFHLFDIGLRVDRSATAMALNEGADDEKQADPVGVTVDKWFAVERDQIRSQRQESKLDMDRIEEANTKFVIQSIAALEGAITLMDALFQKLTKSKVVQSAALEKLRGYFNENSFDSDCIEMDIEDIEDSNVHKVIQNEVAIELMADLIRITNLRRRAFSTGFVFNYWDWSNKKKPRWVDDEMTVKPMHQTLKEEVLESGFLSAAEWMEFVELKAQKFMKSKKVRGIKAERAAFSGIRTTGQHTKGSPLTVQHLYAIILYCDFGVLCTAFSNTFRLQDAFESVESLKSRHSKFAIFARLLVELVLDFGINGDGETTGHQRGPFFCGLNCALNIGSFAIKLKGPCSTTIQREVAVNFAKSDGIILKLDNDGLHAKCQPFFDCSWISNYFEEAERLWIAGREELRIVSVVIVRSAKNYRNMLRALFLFDAMTSGVYVGGLKIKEKESDRELLSKLIEVQLSDGDIGAMDIDLYLKNEWELFVANKQEIYLVMNNVYDYFKLLSKLIVFNVVEYEDEEEAAKEQDNVLRTEWLSIFPALRTVRINTWGYEYKFRLEALLETLQSVSRSITFIVEDEGYWIQKALTDKVHTEYAENGWNIEYKEEEKRWNNKLVIKGKE